MCHENRHVDFEYGSGRISCGRVMPIGLRKIPICIGFRSLSASQMNILNWNSVYTCRCVTKIRSWSRVWFPLNNFRQSYSPWTNNFWLSLIISVICHAWTFSIEIRNIHVFQEYTGQVHKYGSSQIIRNPRGGGGGHPCRIDTNDY